MTQQDYNKLLMHILIQWLTNKNILDTWLNNISIHAERAGTPAQKSQRLITLTNDMTHEPHRAMSICFIWNNTPEGTNYWIALYKEWQSYVREINKHVKRRNIYEQ